MAYDNDFDKTDAVGHAFAQLRPVVLEHFVAPPLEELEAAGQRRHRRFVVASSAVLVVLALVVGGAVGTRFLPDGRPQPPASPSPSVSSSPAGFVMPVDWRNTKIDLPAWKYAPGRVDGRPDCGAKGTVVFGSGIATAGNTRFKMLADMELPQTGRLAGLDSPVWLVTLYCAHLSLANIGGSEGAVLAVTREPDGTLRGLGYLASFREGMLSAFGFAEGNAYVVVKGDAANAHGLVQRRVFRWTGSQLQQLGGPTAFPDMVRMSDVDPANWTYPVGVLGGGYDRPRLLAAPDCPLDLNADMGLLDGVGEVTVFPGAVVGSGTGCGNVTGTLLASVRGSLPNLPAVVFATVRVTAGSDTYVGVYAIYDYLGRVAAELLLPQEGGTPLRDAGTPRITGNGLEVTARTDQAEKTYRWRWASHVAQGHTNWSFELSP